MSKFSQYSFPFQSYDTSESKLRREFEVYGPVKRSQVSISLSLNFYPGIFLIFQLTMLKCDVNAR